jgi:UV DNA damage endonuclease
MKIGYPCINRKISCTANSTFRLKSYSEKFLSSKIENNLACLDTILRFNVLHGILFFRISSDLVPFASHPVCKFDWRYNFKDKLKVIGDYIKLNNIRISMHPDQFILINAKDEKIIERSISELEYHADVLDLMGLDQSAKIQIHVGGVYGDKEKSIGRFIEHYGRLSKKILKRLVIENDDRNYELRDCIKINNEIGLPVLFDVFHHKLKNNGESVSEALGITSDTWKKSDGIPMVDYSSQKYGAKQGAHTEHINQKDFKHFLKISQPYDFDVMLEIKDKEKSALKAVGYARNDYRFINKIHEESLMSSTEYHKVGL